MAVISQIFMVYKPITHSWVVHGYIILLQHFMGISLHMKKTTNCNFHGYFIGSWEFYGNSMDQSTSAKCLHAVQP